MSTEEPYQPKYTTLEDVPLGSATYDDPDIRDAIERAESRLENEVNDGVELPEHLRGSTAADAVENLATYRLLRPATGPGEKRYGEVAEYGDNQLDYLQTFKEDYRAARDSLIQVGEEEGDESGGGTVEGRFEAI